MNGYNESVNLNVGNYVNSYAASEKDIFSYHEFIRRRWLLDSQCGARFCVFAKNSNSISAHNISEAIKIQFISRILSYCMFFPSWVRLKLVPAYNIYTVILMRTKVTCLQQHFQHQTRQPISLSV